MGQREFVQKYMADLSYKDISGKEETMLFEHEKTGRRLRVSFGLQEGGLPVLEESRDEKEKSLLVLLPQEVEEVGIEALEEYGESLPSRCGITLYEEESLEHTMKDIWFFLNS